MKRMALGLAVVGLGTALPVGAVNEELVQAYKKEFAFLESEKSSLEKRRTEMEEEFRLRRGRLEAELAELEREVIRAGGDADAAEKAIAEMERRDESGSDSAARLSGIVGQAARTLPKENIPFKTPAPENGAPDAEVLREAFAKMGDLTARRASVRREAGSFFLADDNKVEGRIVWIGHVAAYGVSPRGSGALYPAGEGFLKVWPEEASAAAAALDGASAPDRLPIFLFESLEKAVEGRSRETVAGHIAKGGLIGWVIAVLGIPSALMILFRVVILGRTRLYTGRLADRVVPLVRNGRVKEAAELCAAQNGSIARVMHTTLSHLDKDREHLEDIVAEAILHETPRIARFEVPLTVIAAVGPLLGLLGTVSGMITTFRIITEHGAGNPKLVSGGIAEALVATQLGLLLAIPVLLIGSLLNGWADVLVIQMEKAALRVMNHAELARLGLRNGFGGR